MSFSTIPIMGKLILSYFLSNQYPAAVVDHQARLAATYVGWLCEAVHGAVIKSVACLCTLFTTAITSICTSF